jgi:hypothetical protein
VQLSAPIQRPVAEPGDGCRASRRRVNQPFDAEGGEMFHRQTGLQRMRQHVDDAAGEDEMRFQVDGKRRLARTKGQGCGVVRGAAADGAGRRAGRGGLTGAMNCAPTFCARGRVEGRRRGVVRGGCGWRGEACRSRGSCGRNELRPYISCAGQGGRGKARASRRSGGASSERSIGYAKSRSCAPTAGLRAAGEKAREC